MALGIGIDIGEAAVRAAVVESRGSALRLVDCAEAPCVLREELPGALARVRTMLAIRRSVVVGLPAGCAILTTVHPLVVQPRRAELAVAFELQQQLPYDVAQTDWHYEWWSSNGHAARELLALEPRPAAVVAAVKQAILSERMDACRRAGVSVGAVTVSAAALANAWRRRDRTGGAPAGSAPGAEVLLWGERAMAEWVLMSRAGLQAWPVRLAPAGMPSGTVEPGALSASWAAVQEAVEADSQPIPTVWLAGDAAVDPAWVQAVRSECRCAVDVVNPADIVALEPASPTNPERFLVAVGLALQGMGGAPVSLDLTADRRRRRRERRVLRSSHALTAAGAVMAGALAAHMMLAALAQRRTALERLLAQERIYEQMRPEVRRELKRQVRLKKRIQQLEEIAQRRGLLPLAFQRVTEALPDDVWLTKVELSAQEALSGTVDGFARSFQGVTKFMEQLKSSVGWDTVKPLTTSVTAPGASGGELVAFAVRLEQTLGASSPAEEPDDEPSAPGRAGRSVKTPAADAHEPRRPVRSSTTSHGDK